MNKREKAFLDVQPRLDALKRVKANHAERRRNLKDPDSRSVRHFPHWGPGMTTEECVRLFQVLNGKSKKEVGLTFYYLGRQA